MKHFLYRQPARYGLMGGMLLIALSGINPAHAASVLDGPVTALAAAGNRLLIGQGTQFVEAQIDADQLQVITVRDLAAGAIRSIAIRSDGSALVLTESTLFLLDSHDATLDSLAAGGQQIAMNGDQVFVAALEAGVRRVQIANGKLNAEASIVTSAPAVSVALQADNHLWIAEGAGGLWQYAIADPAPPSPIFGDKNAAPATLVRAFDSSIIVGYGNQIGLYTTHTPKLPRALGHFSLGDTASAGEALITASGSLLIGRVDAGGADVSLYPLSGVTSATQPVAQFGTAGAGEHIASAGDQLFYGSIRAGLQRVSLDSNQFKRIQGWNPGAGTPCTLADYTPLVPQPINQGIATPAPDGSITLTWQAACTADRYQVQINDQPTVTVTQPSYSYQPPPGVGIVHWQVTAQIDSQNPSAESPQSIGGLHWTFEIAATGVLAIPHNPDASAVLYVSPSPFGRGLMPQTPLGTLLIAGVLGLMGVLVIVIGAWLIGLTAARFRSRR